MEKLRIKRLGEDARLPTRATEGDAGWDLYAYVGAEVRVGAVTPIHTGLAVEIPHGYVGLIHPRSGLAWRHGITVVNAPGTIDAGFRGEIIVLLTKLDSLNGEYTSINEGDRVAQLIIQKVELPIVEVVEDLADSARGVGGFGSTGR